MSLPGCKSPVTGANMKKGVLHLSLVLCEQKVCAPLSLESTVIKILNLKYYLWMKFLGFVCWDITKLAISNTHVLSPWFHGSGVLPGSSAEGLTGCNQGGSHIHLLIWDEGSSFESVRLLAEFSSSQSQRWDPQLTESGANSQPHGSL